MSIFNTQIENKPRIVTAFRDLMAALTKVSEPKPPTSGEQGEELHDVITEFLTSCHHLGVHGLDLGQACGMTPEQRSAAVSMFNALDVSKDGWVRVKHVSHTCVQTQLPTLECATRHPVHSDLSPNLRSVSKAELKKARELINCPLVEYQNLTASVSDQHNTYHNRFLKILKQILETTNNPQQISENSQTDSRNYKRITTDF